MEFLFDGKNNYQIEIEYKPKSEAQKLIEYARKTLIKAKGNTTDKGVLRKRICKVQSVKEYLYEVQNATEISKTVKSCLLETV